MLDQRREAGVLARDGDAGAVGERATADGVRHVERARRDGVLAARTADRAVSDAAGSAGSALAYAASRTDRTAAAGGAAVGRRAVARARRRAAVGCVTGRRRAARATGAYERKLAGLARVSLLIIDDFGLKPLRPPADEDLHDLIAERYETAATIVTSNLDFPEWDQAFPANRLLASATLDRLRHNAYCLTLEGDSFRAPRQLPVAPRSGLAKTARNSNP